MAEEITPTAPAEDSKAPESVWKEIPLTDGKYLISSDGRVARVLKKGGLRELSPYKNNTPYLAVKVFDGDGKRINKYVHRLVAEAFVPKTEGTEVNHKNGDKTDNRAVNLEWVSHSENNIHKFNVLKCGYPQSAVKILMVDSDRIFGSLKDCAEYLGVSTTTVRRHLQGFTKTVKGVKLIRKETI